MATETNFETFSRAVRSVRQRRARVRRCRNFRRRSSETPIAEIGVFSRELDALERIYDDMDRRLSAARIIIPD